MARHLLYVPSSGGHMWFLCAALAAEPQSVTKPATGRNEATFTLDRFGRYAITSASSQGTQIRVIDRMAGLLAERGIPGERDGRADLFLDRGDVKVVAVSDTAGTGQVTLSVRAYADPPVPPRLQPERKAATSLRDFETRAYWIEVVPGSQEVAIEASGRYLGDLRLWREGSWLVDAAPVCGRIEPATGQPWARCSLQVSLEPGLYLLAAYGGPGEAWAEEKDAAPFEIQWGLPALPAAGQRTDVMGPSGFVRYKLPADTTEAHVALADTAPFRIGMGALSSPFSERYTESITPESRRPAAGVRDSTRTEHVVTLTGPPGKPYTLTWFPATSATVPLTKPGSYWVATVSPADPADVSDPTAVLYRRTTGGQVIRSAAQGLSVSSSSRLSRKFNLAERTTMLLDVEEPGPYVLWIEGAHAQLTVEPYLVDKPQGMAKPEPASDELHIDLDRGLYRLVLSPKSPAIATLNIGHDSWFSRAKRGTGAGPASAPVRPAIQLPRVEVEPGGGLTLELFGAPKVPQGIVVRPLPIDPRDALPIVLLPGERLDIPVDIKEPGVLSLRTPAGAALPTSISGGAPAKQHSLGVGAVTVSVSNATSATQMASLSLLPQRLSPDTPLPALSPDVLAKIPKFPTLSSSSPQSADLGPSERRTFQLGVDKSGLWILESTGLLATEASVRTRTRTGLLSADRNGTGRNFEIAGYLRSGDYQLTVGTVAPSAGHLGLRLRKGPVIDGGEIRDATPARITAGAGAAVRYTLVVAEAGMYHVVQHGQSRLFLCRIEDKDGWPMTDEPQRPCGVDLWLEPGNYTLVGLPERVETRRITTMSRTDLAAAQRTGHGPFELPLARSVTHVWSEDVSSADRPPDIWTLNLPAEIHASVMLSAEMSGELFTGDKSAGRLVPGDVWSGVLPKGPVRIEVRGARRGTGVPYSLAVDPEELVAGVKRAISVPASMPVAVDAAGVYTFESDGSLDVRARLLDSSGAVIATNDDRPDDWNFRLSARLDVGRYRLAIDEIRAVAPRRPAKSSYQAPSSDTGLGSERPYEEPYEEEPYEEEPYEEEPYEEEPSYEGEEDSYEEGNPSDLELSTGPLTVSMRAPAEVNAGSIAENEKKTLRPGADAHLLELSSRVPEIVVARAKSGENVGIAIEAADASGVFRALSYGTGRSAVAAARLEKQSVRVRVWSEDARGGPVDVEVSALAARRVSEGASASVTFGKDDEAILIGGGAGQLLLGGDTRRMLVCASVGEGCTPADDRFAAAGPDGLVVVGRGGALTVERIALSPGESAVLPLTRAPRLLDLDGAGMAAVEVRTAAAQPVARFGQERSLVAKGASLALRRGGKLPVLLSVDAAGGSDGRVSVHGIEHQSKRSLEDGSTLVTIGAASAVTLGFSGSRDAVVSLDAGLLVTAEDGRGQWAASEPIAAHLRGVSGPLLLVNPTSQDRIARVELRPNKGDTELAYGRPHEAIHGATEVWSLLVPPDEPGARIEVEGQVEATYLRTDGLVLSGRSIELGPGGVLSLAVRPGPVLAWVAREGDTGPVRKVANTVEVDLKAGAQVPVRGDGVRLVLKPPGRGVVSIVAPCPSVASVEMTSGWSRTAVLDAGDRLDLWIEDPKAKNIVQLRAFSDTALYGELSSSFSEVSRTGEGLGPEVLLAPGGSAWFSFEVERDGPVGIGAAADAERVDAILHDTSGKELARGLVILRDLPKGSYLLSLSQPVGSGPVRARPAIVGLKAPPTLPPAEIIEQYRALALEKP